jgi:hypothetical protein
VRAAIACLTADTHLAPRAWAGHPGVTGDSYFGLQAVYAVAEKWRLPVVLAGDVFDVNRPDAGSVAVAQGVISTHQLAGLPTYYVQGQHELSAPPWLSLTAASHLHRSTVEVGGVRVRGLDYTRLGRLAGELAAVPAGTDVLVAHQVWREHMGGQAVTEGRFADIPHARVVVSGDFHGHRATPVTGASGQPLLAVSPGTVCLQAADEDPAKYAFVLFDDLTVESVRLPSRPAVRNTVTTERCLDEAVARLRVEADRAVAEAAAAGVPAYLLKPVWLVRCRGDVPHVADRLREVAGDSVHLIASVAHRPPDDGTDGPPVAAGATTMRDCLAAVVDPADDIYETCDRLLASPDPAAEVAAVITDWMAGEFPKTEELT